MTALPKVQQAQYGDSAKLEQLGAGRLTNNPAASVQTWKDMVGGRPAETDPVKLATRAVQQQQKQQAQGQLTPEEQRYQLMFDRFAEQERSVAKWIRLANSPRSGPLTKAWARQALLAYQRNLETLRQQTPFYSED